MKLRSLFILCLLAPAAASAATTISEPNKYAWGANIGWINWRDANGGADGAVIGEFACSGWLWGANVGWIHLGDGTPANGVQYSNTLGTDFGVNHDGTGLLRGLAWGANIGWINFEATGNPRFDCTTGNFSGYAWSANCGWINLGDGSFFVKTNTVLPGGDSDGDGIPDAWELGHAGDLTTLTSTGDADRDGRSDVGEYLDDTDPLDHAEILRYVTFTVAPDFSTYTLRWTSQPTRRYRIRENSILSNPWTLALDNIEPDGGTETERTLSLGAGMRRFFRVEAFRPLGP
jgi:hypothetical protein